MVKRLVQFSIIALFFTFIGQTEAFAQCEITGRVLNGDKPLYGAQLVIKKTSITAITSQKGKFNFIAPRLKISIKVKYKGCKPYNEDLDLKQGHPHDMGDIVLECKDGVE